MSKILIVDDDKNLLEVLKYNLVKENNAVVTASDGAVALDVARREKPDLIILDVMIPIISGFEVCRILRKEMNVPILILSAKTEEVDKVVGLEIGADDYMTKPFSVRELMARVRAMLRRSQLLKTQSDDISSDKAVRIKVGELEVDIAGRTVSQKGVKIKLSPKEFELLAFLMSHRGQVFNRERLVEEIWGYDFDGTARTVDVHMRSLRQKIESNPDQPEHLLTVHGFGYRFQE